MEEEKVKSLHLCEWNTTHTKKDLQKKKDRPSTRDPWRQDPTGGRRSSSSAIPVVREPVRRHQGRDGED
jgi:hypothetical protein